MSAKTALITLVALLGVGCSSAGLDENEDVVSLVDGKDDSLSAARKIIPDEAQHLYFGRPGSAYVDDNQPLSYSWFTANKATEFKTGASIAGGGSTEHVGIKLQRAVKRNGQWKWLVVDSDDSDNGGATVKFTPRSGPGLYLLTATTSPLPNQLTLSLACGGTGCATAGQPGDSCGGKRSTRTGCERDLFCGYTLDAQCGAAYQPGVCTVKPVICPLFYRETCGCDGHTYGNGCEAASAGTSVAHAGSCDVDILGGWGAIDESGNHFDYTFAVDGSFTSTMQPACAFAHPACLIRIALAQGNYTILGDQVSLNYTSDFHQPQNASFTFANDQLTGDDYGHPLELSRK